MFEKIAPIIQDEVNFEGQIESVCFKSLEIVLAGNFLYISENQLEALFPGNEFRLINVTGRRRGSSVTRIEEMH